MTSKFNKFKEHTREDDERLLETLDLRDNENLRIADIAARLRVSKGTVSGILHRSKEAEVTKCACKKPENRDGGLQRGWWR